MRASVRVHGARLERAMEHFEDEGLAERGYETDGGASGYAFGWGQLP